MKQLAEMSSGLSILWFPVWLRLCRAALFVPLLVINFRYGQENSITQPVKYVLPRHLPLLAPVVRRACRHGVKCYPGRHV